MIHRKALIGLFIMILLGGLTAVTGCSSSSGDSTGLENELLDQNFNVATAVPDESLVIDCAADLFELAQLLEQATGETDSFDGDLTGVTINFDGENFSVDDNGTLISTGTWMALDGDTIEITENGVSIPYGITVMGDTIELFLKQETIDAMCDIVENGIDPPFQSPDSSDDANPVPDETPNSSSLTSRLDGTWCYESGYVFYIGVTLPTDGIKNSGFVATDVFVDTEFESDVMREVGINEFLQSAWISTNRLTSGFYRYAPLVLDPLDSTRLTIEYGEGKTAVFHKIDETQGTNCILGDEPLETPEAAEQEPVPADDLVAVDDPAPSD